MTEEDDDLSPEELEELRELERQVLAGEAELVEVGPDGEVKD